MTRPIALQIIDILDDLTGKCADAEGEAVARKWREAIGAICVDNGVVNCVEIDGVVHGPGEHWLIDHLAARVSAPTGIPNTIATREAEREVRAAEQRDAFLEAVRRYVIMMKPGDYASNTRMVREIKATERGTGKYPPAPACTAILKEIIWDCDFLTFFSVPNVEYRLSAAIGGADIGWGRPDTRSLSEQLGRIDWRDLPPHETFH